MPETDSATQNTPLAPSVEKAYYRKCIQLKRRLNEVEAANDEAKIRRLRLERGIMKMRLERAFLLDELRKRMEENVDNSEPSADEGMATPPPERPHRDKRRKQASAQDDAAGAGSAEQSSSHHHHHHDDHDHHHHHHHHSRHSEGASSSRRRTSHAEGNAQDDEAGDTMEVEPPQDSRQRSRSSQFSRERTNGTGLEGGGGGEDARGTNREAGATGEALSAGPAIHEGVNGQRRLAPSASGDSAEAGLL